MISLELIVQSEHKLGINKICLNRLVPTVRKCHSDCCDIPQNIKAMLKGKDLHGISMDSKPKKKGPFKKFYNFLSKKLENTLHPRDSFTVIMQMHSGHFGQLDSTHLAAADTNIARTSSHSFSNGKSSKIFEEPVEKRLDHEEEQRLWKLQVNKCYRRIPAGYFSEELVLQAGLFSRNCERVRANQYELADFLDEVEFNLNSQVNNRFKEFFTFITSMGEIEQLVQANLERLSQLRQNNRQLQERLLAKAGKVQALRLKADNLSKLKLHLSNTKYSSFLNFRRTLSLPNQIRLIFPKDKPKAIHLFNLYTSLHDRSKHFCCRTNPKNCQLVLTRNYLQSNFQIAFTKSFWSYVTEVITYDGAALHSIFGGNKKQFMTTPNIIQSLLKEEESTWEEPQEIVIKENIEEEINWIAVNGFALCCFTTEGLVRDLGEFITSFQKSFLGELLDKVKDCLDIPTSNNLLSLSKGQEVLLAELEPLFEKVSVARFIKVVEIYSDILQKVVRRCLSIVYRILNSFCKLKVRDWREFEEGLLKVAKMVLEFSNTGLLSLIKLKKIGNDFEVTSFQSLLRIFEEWANFSQLMSDIYLQPLPVYSLSIQRVKQILKVQKLQALKKTYMGSYFAQLHRLALSEKLRLGLQQDTWQEVDIEPDYFQSLGYLLEGQKFLEDRKRKSLMASSVLFEKKPCNNAVNPRVHDFKIIGKQIVIRDKRFKATSSTLLLIATLQQYLKVYDSYSQLGPEISCKLLQLLQCYNSYLQQLILGAKAVQLKRIKGNSITARHLSLTYLALQVILELLPSINKHLPLPANEHHRLVEKLQQHEDEIVKKFHTVMSYTMGQECTRVELRAPAPSQGTVNVVNHLKSMYEILSQYFGKGDMTKFFSRNYFARYIDVLIRLKPANKDEAYLKKKDIEYFLEETAQYMDILTDYERMEADLKKMLAALSKH